MANVPSNIGRYKILKAIGHGGMGSLYLAWDAKLERQIAIKVLKEDDDDLRERFAREAKSAARLRHPHIVTIYDLGEHEGQPYIAMEYIRGRTLAQIIREDEDMPLGRTLEWMAALCDGLAFAHKAGIIHRDVKPANIIVDEEGSPKILDFGIARLAESTGMTQTGMMIGTLNYMSPEQISGVTVDHRSDIFAVGLVFYELLTQKTAFPGTISTGILTKLLQDEPVPLAQACPGLDEDVIRIVGRAIEKDVNRRYQDLTQMRREILTVRGHVETGDGLTRPRDTPTPRVPPHKPPSERRVSEHAKQQPAPPIPPPEVQSSSSGARTKVAIAAVIVVLLAAAAYWWGPFRSAAPDATRSDAQLITPPQPQVATPAPAPTSPPIDPQVTRANDLVREGQRLLDESKLDQARAKFEDAQALVTTQAAQDGLAEIDRRQRDSTKIGTESTTAAGPKPGDRALATAAATATKGPEASRKASIDRFKEGQVFEQQRQYDAADAKYREALTADKNNKEAAAALGRSEQYRKASATGLSAFKANDREGALRAFGEARNINSARFLADGLNKTLAEAERLAAATSQPSAEPPPTDDKSAIAAVLGNLSKALSTQTNRSHSLNDVRRFWPGAGGDVFGDNESQTYVLTNPVFVALAGDKASIDCDRRRAMASRSTGKTSLAYDNVRIELRKANGAWQVVTITERSK